MKSYFRVISNVLIHTNFTLTNLTALGLFAILVACSGGNTMATSDKATSDKTRTDISIELDPQQLERGHVVITATLKNTSTDPLTFLPWGTPFESKVTAPFLEIYSEAPNEEGNVPYIGMMLKRAAPVADDYINLGPGRSIKNRLDVTESYRFCKDRSYMMTYAGPLFQHDFSELPFSPLTIEFEAGEAFSPCASTK